MSLVERIQELCSSDNTTLIGLEREVGLGRGTIRNWDKNLPSVDKVEKVADYFNVTTDYLLGKSPFKNRQEYPGLQLAPTPQLHKEPVTENEDEFLLLAHNAEDLTEDERKLLVSELKRTIWTFLEFKKLK